MNYAIVDIETTGGSAAYHKITEICVLLHDGEKVIKEFHSLINPERIISPSITMLTGITNEMVEDAPKFYEVAKEIFQITEGAVFVAHNVNFDFSFLKKEFEDLGGDFKRKKLCTVRLSRKLLPGLRSYSLGNLCESVGIVITDRHRAHGDAKATTELFTMLLDIDTDHTFINHSLKKNSKETSLPPNILKETYDALPEKTGVYFFHDNHGKVIYIGKAKNIKERVCEHFSGNTHTKTRTNFLTNIYDVSYEVTGSELIALLLENEAIKKNYPRYNRTNKSFQLNIGYYSYEDQNGYLRLAIGPCGKRDKPFLTFKTISDATTTALMRIKKYNLCLRLCNLIESTSNCSYDETEEKGHYCSVCREEASVEEYNENFKTAFLNRKNEKTFIIKTPGKSHEEEGFIWVEKGKFLGFGYIPKSQQISEMEEMKEYIRTCYDTQDSQSIIEAHIKKARLIMNEPIAVYV